MVLVLALTMQKTINLIEHQYEFLRSNKKFLALIGGIGSGKSFVLAHYVVKQVVENPESLHFIGANTFSQLRQSTLTAVFTVLQDLEIPYSYNQSSGILDFAGGRVLCKSMENFNALRGIEVGSFIVDEARDLKQEAWDMLMGRLRCKKTKRLEGRLVSSPAGYNWIFDYFHPNGELNTPDFGLIQATSMSNKHLPDGYIAAMKEQYSDTFYQQEVLGQFVNLTAGKVYYAFSRNNNVQETRRMNGSTFIFLDFNVNPLTGVVAQFRDNCIHVIDEFFLENSDTFKLCKEAIDRGYRGATVIPDSTGRNRKTSGESDFAILEQFGFTIQSVANPLVIDRVNAVNRALMNGTIKVNPECKKLINDLEKVTWKNEKIFPGHDGMLGHITDALGYGVWQLLPLGTVPKQKVVLR